MWMPAYKHVYAYKWGFPKIRRTILAGPNDKDYGTLGSVLGSPHLWKLPYLYTHMYFTYTYTGI